MAWPPFAKSWCLWAADARDNSPAVGSLRLLVLTTTLCAWAPGRVAGSIDPASSSLPSDSTIWTASIEEPRGGGDAKNVEGTGLLEPNADDSIIISWDTADLDEGPNVPSSCEKDVQRDHDTTVDRAWISGFRWSFEPTEGDVAHQGVGTESTQRQHDTAVATPQEKLKGETDGNKWQKKSMWGDIEDAVWLQGRSTLGAAHGVFAARAVDDNAQQPLDIAAESAAKQAEAMSEARTRRESTPDTKRSVMEQIANDPLGTMMLRQLVGQIESRYAAETVERHRLAGPPSTASSGRRRGTLCVEEHHPGQQGNVDQEKAASENGNLFQRYYETNTWGRGQRQREYYRSGHPLLFRGLVGTMMQEASHAIDEVVRVELEEEAAAGMMESQEGGRHVGLDIDQDVNDHGDGRADTLQSNINGGDGTAQTTLLPVSQAMESFMSSPYVFATAYLKNYRHAPPPRSPAEFANASVATSSVAVAAALAKLLLWEVPAKAAAGPATQALIEATAPQILPLVNDLRGKIGFRSTLGLIIFMSIFMASMAALDSRWTAGKEGSFAYDEVGVTDVERAALKTPDARKEYEEAQSNYNLRARCEAIVGQAGSDKGLPMCQLTDRSQGIYECGYQTENMGSIARQLGRKAIRTHYMVLEHAFTVLRDFMKSPTPSIDDFVLIGSRVAADDPAVAQLPPLAKVSAVYAGHAATLARSAARIRAQHCDAFASIFEQNSASPPDSMFEFGRDPACAPIFGSDPKDAKVSGGYDPRIERPGWGYKALDGDMVALRNIRRELEQVIPLAAGEKCGPEVGREKIYKIDSPDGKIAIKGCNIEYCESQSTEQNKGRSIVSNLIEDLHNLKKGFETLKCLPTVLGEDSAFLGQNVGKSTERLLPGDCEKENQERLSRSLEAYASHVAIVCAASPRLQRAGLCSASVGARGTSRDTNGKSGKGKKVRGIVEVARILNEKLNKKHAFNNVAAAGRVIFRKQDSATGLDYEADQVKANQIIENVNDWTHRSRKDRAFVISNLVELVESTVVKGRLDLSDVSLKELFKKGGRGEEAVNNLAWITFCGFGTITPQNLYCDAGGRVLKGALSADETVLGWSADETRVIRMTETDVTEGLFPPGFVPLSLAKGDPESGPLMDSRMGGSAENGASRPCPNPDDARQGVAVAYSDAEVRDQPYGPKQHSILLIAWWLAWNFSFAKYVIERHENAASIDSMFEPKDPWQNFYNTIDSVSATYGIVGDAWNSLTASVSGVSDCNDIDEDETKSASKNWKKEVFGTNVLNTKGRWDGAYAKREQDAIPARCLLGNGHVHDVYHSASGYEALKVAIDAEGGRRKKRGSRAIDVVMRAYPDQDWGQVDPFDQARVWLPYAHLVYKALLGIE